MQSLALIVPLKNEEPAVETLILSIKNQSYQPDEIILVDGGSTDGTVTRLNELCAGDNRFRIIEAMDAMPGTGRNIGVEAARTEWIAFTDAGIRLDTHWLENLVKETERSPEPGIVYGNYSPEVNGFFEKCATIAYVIPMKSGSIRSKFIASCLLQKTVWKKSGGFPGWRAAEDLVFMENVEKMNTVVATAPSAMVYWKLQPALSSTFRRFDLYSKFNVWAGRQAYWHYGIARQYALMIGVVLLAIFHSIFWLLVLPAWITARVVKRLIAHKGEFGINIFFNPAIFTTVMIILLTIDAATFTGWIKAIFTKQPELKCRLS